MPTVAKLIFVSAMLALSAGVDAIALAAATPDATGRPDSSGPAATIAGTAVRSDILPGVELMVKPLGRAGVYEVLDDLAGLGRQIFGAGTVDIGSDDDIVIGRDTVSGARDGHVLGQEGTLDRVDAWSGPDPSADWCAAPKARGARFDRQEANRLAAPDGSFWLIGQRSLARWAGDCWRTVGVPLPRSRKGDWIRPGIVEQSTVAVGSDGTLWAGLHLGGWPDHPKGCENCTAKPRLARRDERGWTTFGPEDGVRWLYGVFGGDPVTMAVDGHGTLWIGGHTLPARGPGIKDPNEGCGGVLSFDGKRWEQYRLKAGCVLDIAASPDGSVWVLTEKGAANPAARYPHRLYVITRKAIAAAK
jgi:hypothetical protein